MYYSYVAKMFGHLIFLEWLYIKNTCILYEFFKCQYLVE